MRKGEMRGRRVSGMKKSKV
ncbi:uncharacterized protein G2W53_038181 [Senna tora]|uniref:Uncharacterized protein n=1 Tax=Senna tora TaxID=362788 RepID=A0A834SKI8_9FABA|nr:uncharacterized protein G2W53_038181 [Senna tora]